MALPTITSTKIKRTTWSIDNGDSFFFESHENEPFLRLESSFHKICADNLTHFLALCVSMSFLSPRIGTLPCAAQADQTHSISHKMGVNQMQQQKRCKWRKMGTIETKKDKNAASVLPLMHQRPPPSLSLCQQKSMHNKTSVQLFLPMLECQCFPKVITAK